MSNPLWRAFKRNFQRATCKMLEPARSRDHFAYPHGRVIVGTSLGYAVRCVDFFVKADEITKVSKRNVEQRLPFRA
jgi:hypothetical protein